MPDPDPADQASPPRRVPKCPICGQPTVERYRPFCSKRCADVDLHRWLSGAYVIPVVEEDGSIGEAETTED